MEEEIKPNIKKSSLAERLTTYIFYASVFIFLVAFNFRDSSTGGWYQQFLPTQINNTGIEDFTFLDSLNGYAVTKYNGTNTQAYILKTSNGGDNWSIIRTDTLQFNGFSRVIFLNINTGYVSGQHGIEKTTNAGLTWFNINMPSQQYPGDIFILNQDTIWFANPLGSFGGLYRTTNGGGSWIQQFNNASNPGLIYMYNARIGFICCDGNYVYKTTNSGLNWIYFGTDAFQDIYFTDSLTGYKSLAYEVNGFKKTTDGGVTWQAFSLPNVIGVTTTYKYINRFSYLNDTIYGIGGLVIYPNNALRTLIYKTTNKGLAWGYQIPDTAFKLPDLSFLNFLNNKIGWCYRPNRGIHTLIGGDSTIFTEIKEISKETPDKFKLSQNYPNPFNSTTLINYYIQESGWVKLKIFDITGREMGTLVNEVQGAGGYGVPVSIALSSGVYFYKLIFTNKKGIQTETKKMLMVK